MKTKPSIRGLLRAARAVNAFAATLLLAACATSTPRPASSPPVAAIVVPPLPATPAPAAVEAGASPDSTQTSVSKLPSAETTQEATSTAASPAPKPAIAAPRAKPAPIATPAPPAQEVAASTGPKPAESPAPSLSGHLTLEAQAGQTLSPDDVADTVIYFRPASGAVRVKPGSFQLYTHGRQFDPRVLAIPVGSTVNFPNQDQILHNVFSVSPVATFDLGYYGFGGSGHYTFTRPGVALIYCNVHNAMQADVLVLDTPYFTRPGRDGRFHLRNLPAGAGTLTIWNPRAAAIEIPVAAPASDLQPRLLLTRPLLVEHANKEREAY